MEERTCAWCSTPTSRPRYCSEKCNDAMQFARKKADGRYERDKARARAKYIPKPPRPVRTCDLPDCGEKHLARSLCRKHYRAWQWETGNEAPNPTVVIGCTASLFGAYFPKPKLIKVRVTVGVMASCPWCDSPMSATSPTHRYCLNCGTTAELNKEEVEWVTSEKLSTRASQRTPNSSRVSTLR